MADITVRDSSLLEGSALDNNGTDKRRLTSRRALLVLLLGMTAAYLLLPLLGSVHVEGFTAQIQIGGIAANAGRLDDANLLYPLHAEFFYTTRLGVVLLLQALMGAVGTGDVAFRILTVASFLVFAASTVLVARRHAGVSWPFLVVVLLLTPGLAELGFHFNDNVVSAGLGTLGLALMPRLQGPMPGLTMFQAVRGVLAGVALGGAVLARPDALLLLPVAAGLAWLDAARWRCLVHLGALATTGLLAVLAVAYAGTGISVLEMLQVGRFFDSIQASFRRYSVLAAVFVLFFGLPNLLLVPLGAAKVLRGSNAKRGLVLGLLPALLLAYMARGATEPRHFYPLLAPFILIYGGRGLAWVGAALTSSGWRRGMAGTWALATVAVWLAPPVLVPVADGPRAIVGRLWSPWLWFQWQAAMKRTLDGADGLAATDAPRSLVLTTSFNPDHFLRLRLWQRGWLPGAAWLGCSGFETWRRAGPAGPQELDLIRTENPQLMAPQAASYVEAVQIWQALHCPGLLDGQLLQVFDLSPHHFDSGVMAYLAGQIPGLQPVAVSFGWPPVLNATILARFSPWMLGVLAQDMPIGRLAALDGDGKAGLFRTVGTTLQSFPTETALPAGYEQFMAQFGRGAWRSR